MYDRQTNSLWHQFTGEPIIGQLANSGIRQPFFPVLLTTWGEWLEMHPDTTVLSLETGVYPPNSYVNENEPFAVYNDYFTTPETRFPVWNRDGRLRTKQPVQGVIVGDAKKAYSIVDLWIERVVNDSVGGTDVVVIGSPFSEAARVYERNGRRFALPPGDAALTGLPSEIVDSDGVAWRVTQEALINSADPAMQLKMLPSQTSFWFGWFAFYPDTDLYSRDGG